VASDRPDLTVIVPAFNEARTIAAILDRVDAVPVDKEIVVVDDGSTDGTRAILADLEARWAASGHTSPLRVVLQPENRGKGAALHTGIAEARGRVILVQDADLEYDPADYPKLVAPVLAGEADAVYGSRWLEAPLRVRFGWHATGNRVLTATSNALTGLALTDMETCYKAIRAEVLKSLPLREARFGFEPEVTAHLARLGLRIAEVPIAYRGRSWDEGKKIGWRDGVEAFRVMGRLWRAGAALPRSARRRR
jgi:glycosyltransferase involved in cell wall biosynthesis